MTIITKISFSHPDMALADTISTLSEVDVRILPEAGTDPKHDMHFISVEGGAADEIGSTLADDHTVEEVRVVSDYDDKSIYGVAFTDDTKLLAPRVTEVGGIALKARCGDDGWVESWQLPDREALSDIWEYAREQSFQFDIVELYQLGDERFDESFGLTDEQREALTVAYANGYFKEPRGISLVELAEELDISSAAASGRLRRGLTKLIGATLVE